MSESLHKHHFMLVVIFASAGEHVIRSCKCAHEDRCVRRLGPSEVTWVHSLRSLFIRGSSDFCKNATISRMFIFFVIFRF